MAGQEYGLGDLRWADRRYKTASGTEEIVFSVYGGNLSIGVCKQGEWKPFWQKGINPIRQRVLLARMKEMVSKGPGSKDPIVISRWDPEAKKHVPEWGIEFQKDEKMMYHIVVSWKGNKHDAILRGAYGIAFGSDNITEANASFFGLDDLMTWLDKTVPVQAMLTNKRREQTGGPRQGGAPRQGGNPPAAMNDVSNGDDYF